MYSYILKYKFVLPVLLVLLFASCQKGGEPVPYSNSGGSFSADVIVDSSARLGDVEGDDGKSDEDGSTPSGVGVVGGDDNEDDDGVDIVGGDDNEDDDIAVTVIDDVIVLPIPGNTIPPSSQGGD